MSWNWRDRQGQVTRIWGFTLRAVGRHCRAVSKGAMKRSGMNFEINKTDLPGVA